MRQRLLGGRAAREEVSESVVEEPLLRGELALPGAHARDGRGGVRDVHHAAVIARTRALRRAGGRAAGGIALEAEAAFTRSPSTLVSPRARGLHATTILAVRHRGAVVVAGDGQVTLGQTVMKHNARKVRRLYQGEVLAGFAGATADAFTLFEKFEQKLEAHERQPARAPPSSSPRTGAPTACCAASKRC